MMHASCEQGKSYAVKRYLNIKVPYRCRSFSSVAFDLVPRATSGSGAKVEPIRFLLEALREALLFIAALGWRVLIVVLLHHKTMTFISHLEVCSILDTQIPN